MAGNGRLRHWLGREGIFLLRMVPAWLPHSAPDVKNDMTLIPSWLTFAAGPRLRSFMFRTSVLQNRGVCSSWESQGASQNRGGLLRCSEGAGVSAVVRTVVHAVDMMETVDGSGPGGDFIHENPVNCGSIVPTGDLHRSPPGAVLQQAREPKPAAGERPATPGTHSPKFRMHPTTASVGFSYHAIILSSLNIRPLPNELQSGEAVKIAALLKVVS